jgi:tetratricopeptide (TPR) repeat protein
LIILYLIIVLSISFYFSGKGYFHSAAGLLYYRLGKYDKAITYYQKAIQRDPDNIAYYNNLGYALTKQGKYDEAIENFTKAITFDPEVIQAKMKLAEISLLTGNFERSFIFANEVLQVQNIDTEDRLTMSFISVCSLFFQKKRSEAFNELKEFIEYYVSLSKDYERGWNYTESKRFISGSTQLTKTEKALLLKVIDILESSKSESEKKLKEIKSFIAN